jgi:MFS transporter, DHA3 family, tetracycline resistance protein
LQLQPDQAQAYRAFLFWNGGFAFAITIVTLTGLIYQFTVAHLSPLQMVLVGTMLEIVCFVSQIPTGLIADLYGRRGAIAGGTLLVGIGFTIEGLFPNFAAILLAQLFWGLGATFVDGADGAWLAGEVGEDHLDLIYLRSGQIGQALTMAAIPLSIGLANIRLNIPIVTGGVLFMVLAGVALSLMRERAFTPPPRAERTTWQMMGRTLRQGMRSVRLSPILGLLLAIELCYGLASEGFDRLWQPLFLTGFAVPRIGFFETGHMDRCL